MQVPVRRGDGEDRQAHGLAAPWRGCSARTAKALSALRASQWLVVHDVECSRGNYDHIVVGRGGVLLLDTKNLQGSVYTQNGWPRLRRRLDPEADHLCAGMQGSALRGAADLSAELARRTSRHVWVQAVVVLWSDFDEGVFEGGRCVIVQGSRVHQWICEQPISLDEGTADELSQAVLALADDARTGHRKSLTAGARGRS